MVYYPAEFPYAEPAIALTGIRTWHPGPGGAGMNRREVLRLLAYTGVNLANLGVAASVLILPAALDANTGEDHFMMTGMG